MTIQPCRSSSRSSLRRSLKRRNDRTERDPSRSLKRSAGAVTRAVTESHRGPNRLAPEAQRRRCRPERGRLSYPREIAQRRKSRESPRCGNRFSSDRRIVIVSFGVAEAFRHSWDASRRVARKRDERRNDETRTRDAEASSRMIARQGCGVTL